MKIHHCADYGEMSRLCSDSILLRLKKHPETLLCAATGNSPMGVYENLTRAYPKEPSVFGSLSILKLDEWGGIPASDPNSCETFIQQKILKPLHISTDRYSSFNSNSSSPEQECQRIQQEIKKKGPIDICVLGLGKNGHIGFNEPGNALMHNCHIADLSEESLQHQMTNGMKNKPTYGLTLGMADILQSKKIILLITGSNKEKVIKDFLSKKITTHLPASFLWLHGQVDCFIDSASV